MLIHDERNFNCVICSNRYSGVNFANVITSLALVWEVNCAPDMVTVYAVSVFVRPVGLVMIVAAKMIRRTALLVMTRQSALDTENVSAINAFVIRKVAFSENSATSVR